MKTCSDCANICFDNFGSPYCILWYDYLLVLNNKKNCDCWIKEQPVLTYIGW